MTLKENLLKAEEHTYIVTEWEQTLTLIALRPSEPGTLTVEEISIPSYLAPPAPISWSRWIEQGAPHHTSWSMIEFDTATGDVRECYSFSQARWMTLSKQESLLSTLLDLPLTPEPAQALRHIGPPPLQDEPDHRKLWIPPFHFNEQLIPLHSVDVFSATWPQDNSPLAGEKILLYFDPHRRSLFPFWIQIETAHISIAIQVRASGSHLTSLYSSLPKRTPHFLGPSESIDGGIRFKLFSPKYYTRFHLFAIDTDKNQRDILEMPHITTCIQSELLHLEIEQTSLQEILKPGHTYTWLLIPINREDCFTESPEPFSFQSNSHS